jgi:hypothetical protein
METAKVAVPISGGQASRDGVRQALPISVLQARPVAPVAYASRVLEFRTASPANPLLFGLQLGDSDTQSLLHGSDRRRILVRLARPEEALEAILASPRHDMDVQMWNALADAIVDGDEGTVGLQALLDRSRQELRVGHQGGEQSGWQVEQRAVVSFGNQEAVSWKEGPMIEKGQRHVVLEHCVAGDLAADDPTEGAGFHGSPPRIGWLL